MLLLGNPEWELYIYPVSKVTNRRINVILDDAEHRHNIYQNKMAANNISIHQYFVVLDDFAFFYLSYLKIALKFLGFLIVLYNWPFLLLYFLQENLLF